MLNTFCLWCASSRVIDLLNQSDPRSVSLDEAKAEQILNLANNMLLLICSQTPIIRTLNKSCQFTHVYTIYNHNSTHRTFSENILKLQKNVKYLQIPARCAWIRKQPTQS